MKARGLCERHYEIWWRYERERPACSMNGCEKPARTRGYCTTHYGRLLKNGDPEISKYERNPPKSCTVTGCANPYSAKGLCAKHYARKQNTGTTDDPGPRERSLEWRKDHHGYMVRYEPEHPNASRSTARVSQHVYVMSEHIGRALHKGETVHHKNGIRDDNRIENLELWKSAHPPGQRITDLVVWAREILEQYGEDVDAGRIS